MYLVPTFKQTYKILKKQLSHQRRIQFCICNYLKSIYNQHYKNNNKLIKYYETELILPTIKPFLLDW